MFNLYVNVKRLSLLLSHGPQRHRSLYVSNSENGDINSVVVKEARKKSGSLKVTVQRKPHNKQAHLKREQRNVGMFGTGTECNIGVVKTKLVNVFATRFSPNLDADTLRGYLSEKLENGKVTCRKIESAQAGRLISHHH